MLIIKSMAKIKRLGLERPSFIKKLENVTKQLLVEEELLKNEVEKR